jgi:hypothetical protein
MMIRVDSLGTDEVSRAGFGLDDMVAALLQFLGVHFSFRSPV